jgi:hypothetical protein
MAKRTVKASPKQALPSKPKANKNTSKSNKKITKSTPKPSPEVAKNIASPPPKKAGVKKVAVKKEKKAKVQSGLKGYTPAQY